MKNCLYVITLLLIFKTAFAQQLHCNVVAIHDGDTITCLTEEKNQVRIRLANIDAPEKGQPFGQAAKRQLSKLLYNQQVKAKISHYDRYGRLIAEIYTTYEEPINLLMVKKGMAWVYERYLTDSRYLNAQEDAQKLKIGLWIDKNPIPPEQFRKQ